MRPLRLAAVLALAPLALGCDAEESLLGEFRGAVTVGDAVTAVEGEAVYTVVDTEAGPTFVLGMFVDGLYESDFDAYDVVLFRRPGGLPGVGAYAVDDDPSSAVAATIARVDDADEPLEASGVVLTGTGGTLALTRIDGYGFLTGTYRFDAVGVTVGSARAVSGAARGTFEARYEPPATFRRLGVDLGV